MGNIDKQFISTTGGNCIINSESHIYVNIREGEYVQKEARDINIGDMVLFRKDSIETTLEEVEPFLTRNPVYANAKQQLHEINSKGEHIPRLRTLLIRGLKAADSRDSLEEKIMLENGDFSRTEYSSMVNAIKGTVEKYGFEPLSYSGHRLWIAGKVVGPNNWDFFKALSEINAEFKEWQENEVNPNSKLRQYKIYTTVRRGIMRYLAKCKGLGKGKKEEDEENLEDDENSPYGVKLTPYIKPVLEHFVKDINRDYNVVRVTNVSKLFKKNQETCIEKNVKKLSKGIVVNKPEDIELKIVPHKTLAEEQYIMQFYLRKIIDKFDTSLKRVNFIIDQAGNKVCSIEDSLLEELYGEQTDNEIISRESHFRRAIELIESSNVIKYEDNKKFICFVKENIISGELDRKLSLKYGTVLKLMDTYNKLATSLPRRVKEYQRISRDHETSANSTFNMKNEIEKNYGLRYSTSGVYMPENKFISDAYFSMNPGGCPCCTDVPNLKTHPPEFVSQFLESLKNKGIRLLKRKDAFEILAKYGLEEVIKIKENEFCLDNFKGNSKLGSYFKKVTDFFRKKD